MGRIDALINNAGYGSYGAVEEVPLKEARDQMEVNLFGAAHLIQLFLPLMRSQRFGRIINVTSIGGKIWSPLGAWYQASKFALEGFSDCLRNELKPFGIEVVVIEPGGIQTEWSGIAANNIEKVSGKGPYAPIAHAFSGLMESEAAIKMMAHPKVIADAIETALTSSRPKARYVAPFSGKVLLFLRWTLSDRMFDRLASAAFKIPKKIVSE